MDGPILGSAQRENSTRSIGARSVIVATVERKSPEKGRWSMTMPVVSPSMDSTFGGSRWGRRFRRYTGNVSLS